MKNVVMTVSITLCMAALVLAGALYWGYLYSPMQMQSALAASTNFDITNARLAWDAPKPKH